MNNDENIHIGELLRLFILSWRIYVPIGLVCLIFAFVFIAVTPREYDVMASMQLLGERQGMMSELKMLKSSGVGELLGLSGSGGVNTENEIAILESREVLGAAIVDAGMQKEVSTRRGLKRVRLSSAESPISIDVSQNVLDTLSRPIEMKISVNGDKLTKMTVKSRLFDKVTLSDRTMPCVVELPACSIEIRRNAVCDGNFKVKILPLQYVYERELKLLDIYAVEKVSDVISISERSSDVATSSLLLNSLMKRYNIYQRDVKLTDADVNSRFVRERLDTVTRELAALEYAIEGYKQNNKIVDPKLYLDVAYNSDMELEKSILGQETSLRMIEYLIEYMRKPENEYAAVPVIDGIGEKTVAEYNRLLLERQRLLLSSEDGNPALLLVNKQIEEQRKMLIDAAGGAKNSAKAGLDMLYGKERSIDGQIDKLPKMEREYIEMKRQQKIKETIYLFLMQKLQEKELANSPDEVAARIVDKAYSSYRHVFPKLSVVLAIALLMAIILSVIAVGLKLTHNK